MLIHMIIDKAIQYADITVLEGYRDEKAQNEAYDKGMSQVRFPNSKHNTYPSMAVDAVPYPIDWKDTERLAYFAGMIKGIANVMLLGTGYKLVSGIDWDDDLNINEHKFLDYPHFELIKDATNT